MPRFAWVCGPSNPRVESDPQGIQERPGPDQGFRDHRRRWDRQRATRPARLLEDVAAHLKRDHSTVQRWERREDRPVHRHIHDRLGSVYAFRSELDAWQRARSMRARTLESDDTMLPATPRVARWRLAPFVAAAVLSAAAGPWAMYFGQTSGPGATFAPSIRSIVVLPLVNLSGDPGQESSGGRSHRGADRHTGAASIARRLTNETDRRHLRRH
jgi:hypothetical protein